MKDLMTADQLTPVVMDSVPPLPPSNRHQRPRVRDVSSRFMSSLTSPSPSHSDLQNHHHVPKSPVSRHTPMPTTEIHSRPQHRSKSAQRQRVGGGEGQEGEGAEPLSSRAADDTNIQLDTTRSLESPLKGLHSIKGSVVQRNTKRGASVKLVFKENKEGRSEQQQQQQQSEVWRRRGGNFATPSRPDTPTVSTSTNTGRDYRVVSSRFRIAGTGQKGINSSITNTAAGKLLQSSGMMSKSLDAAQLPPNPHASNSIGNDGTSGNENHSCPTPSNPSLDCASVADSEEDVMQEDTRLRSSLPEVDVSNTLLADRSCIVGSNAVGCNSSKFSASPCSRSLNLPLSSYEQSSLLHTVGKTGEKPTKHLANSGKMGSLCLPPLPCPKQGGASKKGRKDSSHAEQVHCLKMLQNHYLQWRYANAKAEASMHAQRREAERDLYSLQVKLSHLRDAVQRKQIEHGLWKRTQTLSTILQAHMPYLDEWSTLEAEYLPSLTGVIDALVNASLQLPVSGNVQVDIREVREALNAALKMTETICFHLQSFMPEAEEIDTLISELARVSSGERALAEECGHLLFKTCASQVEECSLKGHLIQLHSSNHHQAKKE